MSGKIKRDFATFFSIFNFFFSAMYTFLEIELIFQNIKTHQEWREVVSIFAWLCLHFPNEVYYSEEHRKHFAEISNKKLREL